MPAEAGIQRGRANGDASCTIEDMTNSDSSTSINDETPDLPTTPETRAEALNRLREAENQRLDVERVVRKRLMWLGIVVGATVGLTVGYLGTLITIVDNGIGEFGFQFYRPNFVESFLRIITAYILGGGAVGGALSYVLFTTRAEASSPIRWIIAGIVYALGAPLLIGFLLPLTILIFVDFFEGLRPGLWISAFVETLLGSFLDGYIYMVKVLSAGVTGAVLFLIIAIGTHIASLRSVFAESSSRTISSSVPYYVVAAIIALIPLVLLAVGPFSLVTDFTSFLTGERL